MSPFFKKKKDDDWFLPKDVREQLIKTFDGLKDTVTLEVFTQPGVNDEFSNYMVKFCTDLAKITDKIEVKGFEIPSARADELGVTASPTMCINPDTYHIRFLGAPLGEEGKAFITAIVLVSLGMHGLSDISSQILDELNEERLAQVFVSPT